MRSATQIQAAYRGRNTRERVQKYRRENAEDIKMAEFRRKYIKGETETKTRKFEPEPIVDEEGDDNDADDEADEAPKPLEPEDVVQPSVNNKSSAKSLLDESQAKELEDRIRRLEEIERNISLKEEKMQQAARIAEEKAAEMMNAMKLMEERAKQEAAEYAARHELLMMAAGPLSSRSAYSTATGMMASNGGMNTRSSRPVSARWPDGKPNSVETAREGYQIPENAPRIIFEGAEWVQLWDPSANAAYWYNENTQEAQWWQPGTQVADDSGYETGGDMTEYSTSNYDSEYENYTDSEYGHENEEWQEYWDEQAQSKYWYNNVTVSGEIRAAYIPIDTDISLLGRSDMDKAFW
jgi:hypothetical protein